MELLKEILIKALEKEQVNVVFPVSQLDVAKIVEIDCYKALQKIKIIIENNNLSDFECIEEIVCLLEEMGSIGSGRHDFS